MASGLPVVATRVGGNPELVRRASPAACFRVSGREALAGTIARYCDNPGLSRVQGEAARAAVEARFTIETMVSGVLPSL